MKKFENKSYIYSLSGFRRVLSDSTKNFKKSILVKIYSSKNINELESKIGFDLESSLYLRAIIEKDYSYIKNEIRSDLNGYIEKIKSDHIKKATIPTSDKDSIKNNTRRIFAHYNTQKKENEIHIYESFLAQVMAGISESGDKDDLNLIRSALK